MPAILLERVISGGQTGADRAALDAGLEAGFAVGGYCPAGRRAEDGPIPRRYPLRELAGGYPERTRKNVAVADGTVIFFATVIGGGTALTRDCCQELGKPHCLVDSDRVPMGEAVRCVRGFISEHGIAVLNVAGPRASGCPSVYEYVKAVMTGVLADMAR